MLLTAQCNQWLMHADRGIDLPNSPLCAFLDYYTGCALHSFCGSILDIIYIAFYKGPNVSK